MSTQICRQSSLKFNFFFNFSITFLLHAFSVESVLAPDWRYEACQPKNCGNGPNISYPFQIIDENIDFCGYPGFEVACEDNKPIYSTSSTESDYIIEDIFYDSHSFRLVNSEVTNLSCPSPQKFFASDRSSFGFGPHFVDLWLFYKCNGLFPRKYAQNLIECASNNTCRSYAVLDTGEKSINCSEMPCESYVAAPVELEGGQQNQTVESIDYIELLRNGFALEWSTAIKLHRV